MSDKGEVVQAITMFAESLAIGLDVEHRPELARIVRVSLHNTFPPENMVEVGPAPVAAAAQASPCVESDAERAPDEIAVAVLGQHHAYTFAELAKRVREFAEDFDAMRLDRDAAASERGKLKIDLAHLRDEYQEAVNERNDALADVSELRREVEDLTASLAKARVGVARLTDERDAARWRGQVEPVTAERPLKVGDRVRLNDATVVREHGGTTCDLRIDGEVDSVGYESTSCVWITAIAGRVRA